MLACVGHLCRRSASAQASKADFLPRGDDLSELRRLVGDLLNDCKLLPALAQLDAACLSLLC